MNLQQGHLDTGNCRVLLGTAGYLGVAKGETMGGINHGIQTPNPTTRVTGLNSHLELELYPQVSACIPTPRNFCESCVC